MRRPAAFAANGDPFSTINTTPMIDIMLVILIMLMLSLPSPTHKVPIDLPTVGSAEAGPPPPVHVLSLDAQGRLAWDAEPISAAALAPRLAALAADPARPALHMRTDVETPYERFDQTIAAVKRAGVSQLGFIGNPPGY